MSERDESIKRNQKETEMTHRENIERLEMLLETTESRAAESHQEHMSLMARFEELGKALKEERDAKDRPTLGACFDRLFEEARTCENLLTWTGWEGSHQQWEVTVRRTDGKTLAQILGDRESTINGLKHRFEDIFAANHENYVNDEEFIKTVLEHCEDVLDA